MGARAGSGRPALGAPIDDVSTRRKGSSGDTSMRPAPGVRFTDPGWTSHRCTPSELIPEAGAPDMHQPWR